MSDLLSLRVALSGLLAQQRGLEITGHNIANANTEGYSRQRVELSANAGPITPAMYARWPGSGLGVDVDRISRLHDEFLETRSLLEHGASGALARSESTMTRLESLFPEPGDSGIGALLGDFWAGWNDVANNPGDQATRTQLLERGRALVDQMQQTASAIDVLRTGMVDELATAAIEVNTIANAVAELNRTIRSAATAGLAHNDLLDQRDVLVRQLADLVGSSQRAAHGETVDIFVGGSALVRGDAAETLLVDVSGPSVMVRFERDGTPAAINGGEVGGILGAVNDVLVRYRDSLDGVATALRDSVNAVHAALAGSLAVGSQDLSAAGPLSFALGVNGVSLPDVTVTGADWSGPGGAAALQASLQGALDASTGTAGTVVATVTGGNGTPIEITLAAGNPTDSVTVGRVAGNNGLAVLLGSVAVGLDGFGGRAFFTGTDAADLAIADDVDADPNAIGVGFAANGPLDGTAALRLGGLVGEPLGADARYRALVVGLGVESQAISRRVEIQETATHQIDADRDSQSGVNLDEELVTMLGFQHAYAASARFMTAIDEVLDTLVNRTGVVGR